MKRLITMISFLAAAGISSCHKPETTTVTEVTTTNVVNDFVNVIALPQYEQLKSRATVLNTAVSTFNSTPTAANLTAARQAWLDTRAAWEQCEGFLIGPVEDDNYDPNMDTWPVDYLQLDSFIANSSSFSVATIQSVGQSLRGFHPLEFILWGRNGNNTPDSIPARKKQYMVGLSEDLLNTVTQLHTSWVSTGGNFQAQMLNAGNGSTRFTTRKEAMMAILDGLMGICEEVGGGKIKEPFDALDSTKAESPFSHNSMTDFTNNLIGAQNVYLCQYNGSTGKSMSQFVGAKNLALDNKIKLQFGTAIAALQSVTVSFEAAIFTQRIQLQNAMDAINDLHSTLDTDVKKLVETYAKD